MGVTDGYLDESGPIDSFDAVGPDPNPPFSPRTTGSTRHISIFDAGTVAVGPGLTHSLALRFTPTGSGRATGTLVIDSTNPARPMASIELDGTGLAPRPLPVVTVVATRPTASELGSPGEFTLTRTGDTTNALTVNFTVGGTATPGADYRSIGTSVTIAAGNVRAILLIFPILDCTNIVLSEGDETVTLALASGAAYTVGSPDTATVTIVDFVFRGPPNVRLPRC